MENIDQKLLNTIDRIELTNRLANLRNMFFDCKPGVASERLQIAMEAWKETEGEPPEQRQAKRLERVLKGVPVVIHPGELLVGSPTKYYRGASPFCDYDGRYLSQLMQEEAGKITLGGPEDRGLVSQEDWEVLIEAAKFFKGKTAADAIHETVQSVTGNWYEDIVEAGGTQDYGWRSPLFNAPDFAKVCAKGLCGIIDEAEDHLRQFTDHKDDDIESLDFWRAVVIGCKATIAFAKRYAQLARDMASYEKDPTRQAELTEISKVCEWVPANPARSFHEALQSMVFMDLALFMEAGECVPPSGWGDIDRDLYPYFKRDLQEGRLSLEKAAELIGMLITYTARREWVVQISWRDYLQKGCLGSIGLGGPNRNGGDASNELTYLVLHMMGLLKYAEPHIVIRWQTGIPRWLLLKAIDTNLKVRGGVPQFQNGDHIVKYWMDRGISRENAREFVTHGCSQAVPADTRTAMQPSYLNIALPVDLALHNGVASATGKRVAFETGDPRTFKTFEQFYDAYKKQCEFLLRKCLWIHRIIEKVKQEWWRMPLSSALAPGCLEKGRDFGRGGLPNYATWFQKDRGIIPAADSLYAVKKLVFDDKKLSMSELIETLDANFEGERGEEIRQMCLAIPKYGNDNDEVDLMVRDVAKFTSGVIFSEKNSFGWPYAVNRNGQGWHFQNGKKLAALPNGRKAREPLVDGSLSPMQGMDTHGPTAMLRSALKADFKEAAASVLNVKFPRSLFQSPVNQEKLIDFMESFFKGGGSYIQFNLLDKNELLEAKRHPEKYRDLVVRVGGYSAYFVTLSPEIQDEIIRRTEYAM